MLNGHKRANGVPPILLRAHERWEFDTSPDSRYRRILVPTGMNPADQAALELGLQLTAIHDACLTVLHVVPSRRPNGPARGLDAIGVLHQAAFDLNARAEARAAAETPEVARLAVTEFLQRVIAPSLQLGAEFCVECRTGSVPEEIARFAEESDADLVILSCRSSRWPWRRFPPSVRDVLRLTQRRVILAPCQANRTSDVAAKPRAAANARPRLSPTLLRAFGRHPSQDIGDVS